MSTVDMVLTETRVWAVGPATHWNAAPSVVLGSDGSLVVGESLMPPTQVSSAVQYVPADRIALPPRLPTVTEAMSAVVAAVLDNLGVRVPAARVTVVCPTEWGGRRRAVVAEALRGVAGAVTFVETATRAVAADPDAVRARRTVVLECGPLATTASSVAPGPQGVHLESCEFEPNLVVADLGADPRATELLSGLIGGLLDGRPVDIVQVFGLSDPEVLRALREEVGRICGPDTEVRQISGADLVRPAQREPEYRPAPAALPADEWLGPLRERAAAQRDPRERRAALILGGVAAAVVVAAVGVGAVVVLGGSDEERAAVPEPVVTSTVEPTTVPSVPSSTVAQPAPEMFGRLRFEIPAGWRTGAASGGSRLDLAPADGTRSRITLTQTPVAADAGYEQVAANLESQMRQKPTMSELRRDVVFGGRSMLAYTERPEGGSTVNWHVLVEHGTQVSIGCQYIGDGWDALADTCDSFAASVHVLA